MKIRAFAFAAIVLTAACSPDAGVGPTDHKSNGTTTAAPIDDKRASADSTAFRCNTAFTDGKGSCVPSRWNASTGKR